MFKEANEQLPRISWPEWKILISYNLYLTVSQTRDPMLIVIILHDDFMEMFKVCM